MENFGFGGNEFKNPISTTRRRFAPFGIYNVKLENVEVAEIKGTKDPNAVYKILRVRFSNDEGYYEESIFFPDMNEATKRPKFPGRDGGPDYEMPSTWERIKMFIAQTANTLNPEGFKKFQDASGKFKSFDDIANAYVKIMSKAIGAETELKLVARQRKDGAIEPTLPRFVRLNRDGVLYCSDNFIGKNLFFTPYEEKEKAKFMNAKPTDMGASNIPDSFETSSDDEEPLDLESLL